MSFTIFEIIMNTHNVCDSYVNIIRGCKDKKTDLCRIVFETYLQECNSYYSKHNTAIHTKSTTMPETTKNLR